MPELKVGDEVRVFARARHNHPDVCPGTVVKVGRILVTIAYGSAEDKFRMDTGMIAGNYGGIWFKTLEQVAADERAEAAEKVLRAAGFVIRLGHHPDGALIEALASVAEKFTTEGES